MPTPSVQVNALLSSDSGIVLAFMFFIYRGAGLVSWAALGINIVLVMALLATVERPH